MLEKKAKAGAEGNTEVYITNMAFDFPDSLVITLEYKNIFSPRLPLFISVLMYRMW